MPYPEFASPSPNRAEVPVHEKLGVCFHHSISTFEQTIAKMTDPTSRVSYHALIALDGTRCRLVEDDAIAWHAGVSVFRGRPNGNDFLLGLAFAGDTYGTPLSDHQLQSALDWLTQRWTKYRWTAPAMTDHRQISPGRKDDLNPVEWDRLIAAIKTQFAT